MSQDQSLIKKIKALLNKTIEQGCSEEEALAAMTKAHELLEKYQLNLSDLDIREEGTEHLITVLDQIKNDLAVRVGSYCECKVWKSGKELHFLGIKTDAQFAEWLILALTNYVNVQQLNFVFDSPTITTKLEEQSFVQGCVKRINDRLYEEIQKRKQVQSTGRDLIPLKNAMITEEMARLGISLRHSKAKQNRTFVDHFAYSRGMAAGNNVGFNRPIHRDKAEETRLLK